MILCTTSPALRACAAFVSLDIRGIVHCLKSKTELWDTDELFHSIERRRTLKGWVNINSYHALEFNLSDLGKNLKFWFLLPSRIIPSV
jgi:hypothetical protein